MRYENTTGIEFVHLVSVVVAHRDDTPACLGQVSSVYIPQLSYGLLQ